MRRAAAAKIPYSALSGAVTEADALKIDGYYFYVSVVEALGEHASPFHSSLHCPAACCPHSLSPMSPARGGSFTQIAGEARESAVDPWGQLF